MKVGEIMSQAITNSESFTVTGNDDGKEHLRRHEREDDFRKWKKFDSFDEGIIQLFGDKRHTREQALEVAQKQGLLSEDEWEEKNQKKKPSRRQASYKEYLESTSASLVKQLGKNASAKNGKGQQAKQQLIAINYNQGLAIHGSLYYLGDVENYNTRRKTDYEIKIYREFEVETFKEFFNSELYQALHEGTQVRAEIHTDEAGAIHLQTSDVYFKSNSRGRVQTAKNTMREEALKNYLGDDTFEMLLKREKYITTAEKEKDRTLTTDEVKRLKSSKLDDLSVSKRERSMYLNQLFRRLESEKLEEIARDKAKEYGVAWEREYNVSDGEYLSKDAYKKVQEVKRIENLKTKWRETRLNTKSGELTRKEKALSDKESELEKVEKELEFKGELVKKEAYLDMIEYFDPNYTVAEFKRDTDFEGVRENELKGLKRRGLNVNSMDKPISTAEGRGAFRVYTSDFIKTAIDKVLNSKAFEKVKEAHEKLIERGKDVSFENMYDFIIGELGKDEMQEPRQSIKRDKERDFDF